MLQYNRDESFEGWLSGKYSEICDYLGSIVREKSDADGIDFAKLYPAVEEISNAVNTFSRINPRDINYNLPNMDIAYTSWYLPRRIGDCLPVMDMIFRRGKCRKIYDIGAGSGAALVALLIRSSYEKSIDKTVEFEYTPCDISSFGFTMMKSFYEKFPFEHDVTLKEEIQLDWRNLSVEWSETCIVSSYLFSIDECSDNNVVETAKRFHGIFKSASEIYLFTSNKKINIIEELASLFFEKSSIEIKNFGNLPVDCRSFTRIRQDIHNHERDRIAPKEMSKFLLLNRVTWRSEGDEQTNYLALVED